MFHFKISSNLFYLLAILFIIKFCAAELEECDSLIIEGSSSSLKKIFTDFNAIKDTMNEIKSRMEECPSTAEKINPQDQPLFDIRYDALPKKCVTEYLPKNCAEATFCLRRSGIYKILPQNTFEPFYVECDATTENGDWIVIQRRQDGSEDFHRNFTDYEAGFGDIDFEFFIGLKKLYALTNYNGPQELLIVMEHSKNTRVFAKYNTFAIGNDTEVYKLKKLGKYSGTAGDSLTQHLGMKFTTKDHDDDISNPSNCAVKYSGAWWHKLCHHSNLNGKYGDKTEGKGVIWYTLTGNNSSLKYVKMMIRRRRSVS